MQDDAYGELKDARRDQKQKHGPYSANRWFSQQVGFCRQCVLMRAARPVLGHTGMLSEPLSASPAACRALGGSEACLRAPRLAWELAKNKHWHSS